MTELESAKIPENKPVSTGNTPLLPSRERPNQSQDLWQQWIVSLLGLILLHFSHPVFWIGQSKALWYPPVGFGLILVAWVGWRGLVIALADVMLIRFSYGHSLTPEISLLPELVLTGAELYLAWWFYKDICQGKRRVNDPTSATYFLLIVPGAVAVCISVFRAWLSSQGEFWENLICIWLSHSIGFLALAPFFLVTLTPTLSRWGFITNDPTQQVNWIDPVDRLTLGDCLEIVGLCLGSGILTILVTSAHLQMAKINWHFWALLLLVVIWASLRQGLRGGSAVAGSSAVVALGMGAALASIDNPSFISLQGNLLALCSTGLLVGASSGWIRASEMRYRQVVGHIPVVLYSTRLLEPIGRKSQPKARVLLVSAACQQILGCSPTSLVGDYQLWLERVHPEDRELLIAAFAQLGLQKETVKVEYRLNPELIPQGYFPISPRPSVSSLPNFGATHREAKPERWVRDTLAPNYDRKGRLEGWEGVVEDITDQRQLSHDLNRTTTMLHTLVANLPAGVIFVQGPMGQPLLVNARAQELLGQREEPIAGINHWPRIYRFFRPDGSLYPWDELPVFQALHLGVPNMRDDIIIHRPDGRHIPLVTWATPIDLGQKERLQAAVWVFEDLTALKQAEAARVDSETRLRTVIESMSEGLVIQDQEGAVIECNSGACSILETTQEDLLSRWSLGPNAECFNEDGSPLAREEQPDWVALHSKQAVRNKVIGIPAGTTEFKESKESRELRWILANSVPLTTGQTGKSGFLVRVVTTFSDITESRRQLANLSAAEEKYRTLIENLPLMILQTDENLQITYSNPLMDELLNSLNSDTGDKAGSWETILSGANHSSFAQSVERALQGESNRAEFRFQLKDGKEKFCYGFSNPLFRKGKVAGCSLVMVDLTLQRRLESEIGRVQQLELVGRLASGIVHDFNNLITAISTMANIAQLKLPPGNDVLEDLQTIQSAAEEAARLAAQLLTFSKQRKSDYHPVDLVDVVQRTLDLLRGNLPKEINLKSHLCPESLNVFADQGQMQQIIMNLCLNARDAMAEGGDLVVRTSREKDLPDDLASDSAGTNSWIRLIIEDSGKGIPANIQNKIYDPFFSTKERGTGLGLAVVRQLVDSFAGKIKLWSEPGKGTRFEVWLPEYDSEGNKT